MRYRTMGALRPAGATLATVTINDLGMSCQQYLALSTIDQAHAIARATNYPDSNWYVAVSAAAQIAQQCQTQLAEAQASGNAGPSSDASPSGGDSGAPASTGSSKLPWIIGGSVVAVAAIATVAVVLRRRHRR